MTQGCNLALVFAGVINIWIRLSGDFDLDSHGLLLRAGLGLGTPGMGGVNIPNFRHIYQVSPRPICTTARTMLYDFRCLPKPKLPKLVLKKIPRMMDR